MKVVLGICALDHVATPHYTQLLKMTLRQTMDKKRNKEVQIIGALVVQGNIIPDSRRMLVEAALEQSPATHIWFIDSDIVPEDDTLGRLAAHNREIVCAQYPSRFPPHHPLINYPIPIEPSEKGLASLANTGLGCCLVDLQIFNKLPRPWFNYQLGNVPGKTRDISEDAWFCMQARNTGLKIWLDRSINLGHVGQKVYKLGDV